VCCVLCDVFFNDTATTEIYTLSLHDALPIFVCCVCMLRGVLCVGRCELLMCIARCVLCLVWGVSCIECCGVV